MKDTITYTKLTLRGFLRRPGLPTLLHSLRYYSAWRTSLVPGRNSVKDQLPWMAFSAIAFLKKIIRPDMQVFEYGSGGSTLFWAARVQQVISIEHDKKWFDRMQQELNSRQQTHVTYLLREAQNDPDFQKKDYRNPNDYISIDDNYKGKNFESYVKTLDQYPDASFDIIVVDGRARPSCIQHSLDKLKKGGYLIVDNAERDYYLAPFRFDSKEWHIRTFGGPVPYVRDPSNTTFLKKR